MFFRDGGLMDNSGLVQLQQPQFPGADDCRLDFNDDLSPLDQIMYKQ